LRALRRACAAGALATLKSGAGNCAPDGQAIDAAIAGKVR
jgi:ribokinase